jgi:hypothetical protein
MNLVAGSTEASFLGGVLVRVQLGGTYFFKAMRRAGLPMIRVWVVTVLSK